MFLRIFAVLVTLFISVNLAFAADCFDYENQYMCVHAPGEHVFATADDLTAYLAEFDLDFIMEGQTISVPNQAQVPIGTRFWLYANEDTGMIVTIGFRPGGPIELFLLSVPGSTGI